MLNVINKVADTLIKVKVAGEKPTVYRTGLLSVHLDRKLPTEITGATLQEGKSSFTLPQTNELQGGGNAAFVDFQVCEGADFFLSNAFTLNQVYLSSPHSISVYQLISFEKWEIDHYLETLKVN